MLYSVLLAVNFLLLASFAECERIIKQDANTLATEKMDAMMNRLNRLERSVNTLKAQCSCQTQKFIDSEITSNVAPKPKVPASTCTAQTLKICERPGISEINFNGKQIKVLCGSDRWIIILQRFDGSVPFHNKNWESFKQGIGTINPSSEFFLGLQNLHDITSDKNVELRFDLEDFDGVKKFAKYSDFSIGDETSAFRLGNLGLYSGDAGDSFSYHQEQGFTTLDRDNDGKSIGSCGEEYNSAGWFKSCMEANLMGRYMRGDNSIFKEGMYWERFRGPEYSLKSAKMSIRIKC